MYIPDYTKGGFKLKIFFFFLFIFIFFYLGRLVRPKYHNGNRDGSTVFFNLKEMTINLGFYPPCSFINPASYGWISFTVQTFNLRLEKLEYLKSLLESEIFLKFRSQFPALKKITVFTHPLDKSYNSEDNHEDNLKQKILFQKNIENPIHVCYAPFMEWSVVNHKRLSDNFKQIVFQFVVSIKHSKQLENIKIPKVLLYLIITQIMYSFYR